MIKSMTGYGRGSAGKNHNKINVEIRSLNSRFFEINFIGLNLAFHQEQKLKKMLSNSLERGNIKVYIEIDSINNDKNLEFNKVRYNKTQQVIEKINNDYGQSLQIGDIINTNDILSLTEVKIESEYSLVKASRTAIKQLEKMREEEGLQLAKDLDKRIKILKRCIINIEKLSKGLSLLKTKQLREKINSLVDKEKLDKSRLMQEVAYIVDRSDFTEEIVRTKIHLNTLTNYLKNNDSVGKRINFLIQEINREVNTIGSKSPIVEVTNIVVEMKNEIEKIREQTSNIL